MIRCVASLLPTFLFAVAAPPEEPAREELAARAEAIKPVAEELKWQQIPWVMDLTEGLQMARAENRPILLWVTGDDPLERC